MVNDDILVEVYKIILDRKLNPKPDSYVSSLLNKGQDKILEKIIEEAGEAIIDSKNGIKERIVEEIADLWFHTLILLSYHNLSPQDVYEELKRRRKSH